MKPGNGAREFLAQNINNILSREMITELGPGPVIDIPRNFFLLEPRVSALWCVGVGSFFNEGTGVWSRWSRMTARHGGPEYGHQVAVASFNEVINHGAG